MGSGPEGQHGEVAASRREKWPGTVAAPRETVNAGGGSSAAEQAEPLDGALARPRLLKPALSAYPPARPGPTMRGPLGHAPAALDLRPAFSAMSASPEAAVPEYDLTLFPAPVLRKRAERITEFGDDLKKLVEAMFHRMRESGGVGLAAPQIGLKKRVLVLNPTGEDADDLVLINPTILERTGTVTTYEEGCLSFPGIYAEIERPERCRVRACGLDGEEFEAEYEGFTSRIVQHEYDHLEGVLLVDRMSPADKLRNRYELEDLVARYKRAAAK